MKVKVISLPYIFQVLYVLCFTRPRYQVSVYRTIGPLVRNTISNFNKLVADLDIDTNTPDSCDRRNSNKYVINQQVILLREI